MTGSQIPQALRHRLTPAVRRAQGRVGPVVRSAARHGLLGRRRAEWSAAVELGEAARRQAEEVGPGLRERLPIGGALHELARRRPLHSDDLAKLGAVLQLVPREDAGDLGALRPAVVAGVSPANAPDAVAVLLATGDVLTAADVLGELPDAAVPIRLATRLAHALAAQGFLAEALTVHRRAGPDLGTRESAWRRSYEARAAVLQGAVRPSASRSVRRPARPARPGTVLHVVRRALPQVQVGYTVRTAALTAAQRRQGLDPHVAAILSPTPVRGTVTVDGVPVHRLALPDERGTPADEWLEAATQATAALVERLQPSVLHAHSDYHGALVALALGEAYDLPVVYETRGFWEETWLADQGWWRDHADAYVWRRDLEARCRAEADRVIVLSETMRAHVVALGCSAERVAVVPNGVDPLQFGTPSGRASARGALGLPADALVVGYVTTLRRFEGVDTLVDAVGRLSATDPRIHGLVVGDGPDRDRVAHQAAAGPARNRITFTGRVPREQVTRYLQAMDLFVVPRHRHAVTELVTPLKPFEAMAAGVPLLMSDLPALHDVAPEPGTAAWFTPGDAADLAKALARLADAPDERAAMAEQAARWVRAERTWDRAAERTIEVYRQLGVAC